MELTLDNSASEYHINQAIAFLRKMQTTHPYNNGVLTAECGGGMMRYENRLIRQGFIIGMAYTINDIMTLRLSCKP